jgi:hypothetical protein
MSTHWVINARGGRPAARLRRSRLRCLLRETALAAPFRAGVRGAVEANMTVVGFGVEWEAIGVSKYRSFYTSPVPFCLSYCRAHWPASKIFTY